MSPKNQMNPKSQRCHLQLCDLSLQVGPRSLWRHLQLQAQTGERWVLLGNNGVGKSMLLDVLSGWLAPSQGRVELNGQTLHSLAPMLLASQRAYMTQRLAHHFSVELQDWLQFDALTDPAPWVASLDLQALLPQDVLTLSGGELQRAHLARSLARQAPLLLLDEPISQLDPKHQQMVLEVLLQQTASLQFTVVHDYRWAQRYATHALLLFDDGRFACGPAQEMLSRESLQGLYGVAIE